eukprot:m.135204 g.135204  ORF g.135204 m.135204 type:complete len:776 (-) comp9865_c0_seq1:143-2470(-)
MSTLQKSRAYESKRSDVNDLRTLIRQPDVQRDPVRYRQAVEKVILYMTLGIDVSRLFSEIVLASATRDLVQKKLVYLYLCNYAESNAELALLTVNTLQKDCRDTNPMIRGLALRSMCNLRVPNLIEYLTIPLRNGLADSSPYVRKTAIVGCIKLYYLDATAVEENNIADALYSMIGDKNPQVGANAVIALEEILVTRGGIILTKDIAYSLLNQLKNFSEWDQHAIMNVLLRYKPETDEEVFDILNILDDRLKHSNSGVVLSACRLFLKLTEDFDDMKEDVYERMKVPLITLMSSTPPEISHTVLNHIHLLVKKCPSVFASDYKALFCRFNDPSYVKSKKLSILTDIVTDDNVEKIVEELAACVTDIDEDMARLSVRCVGKIALKLPTALDTILNALFAFIELRTPHLAAETIVIMRDILRKYPEQAANTVEQLYSLIDPTDFTEEDEARDVFVWLLGEHGAHLEEAPYALESYIDSIEEESSSIVKLELLTSSLKLFFKRPPEMQKMLGRLFEALIGDEINQDVHDRALLYYRLLNVNYQEAQRVVCGHSSSVTTIVDADAELKNQIFAEFNTLSVMYNQPYINFIANAHPYDILGQPDATMKVNEERDRDDGESDDEDATDVAEGLLIDTGESASYSHHANFIQSSHLSLKRKPALAPSEFEKMWTSNDVTMVVKDILKSVPTATTPGLIEKAMAKFGVSIIASSPLQGGVIKFFFFAQEEDGVAFHLMEASLDIDARMFSANIKSTSPDTSGLFAMVIREALSDGDLISMDLI